MHEQDAARTIGRKPKQIHQVRWAAHDKVDLEVAHASVDLHRYVVFHAKFHGSAEQMVAQLLHAAATQSALDGIECLESLIRAFATAARHPVPCDRR